MTTAVAEKVEQATKPAKKLAIYLHSYIWAGDPYGCPQEEHHLYATSPPLETGKAVVIHCAHCEICVCRSRGITLACGSSIEDAWKSIGYETVGGPGEGDDGED